MGFYIKHLPNVDTRDESDYIGSRTIFSCANNGAFDGDIDHVLIEYANEHEEVMGIIDSNGIDSCIEVLRGGSCHGRDVNKLTDLIEAKYKNGFMVIY